MCGISGIFDTRERRAIDADLLSRMNDTMIHRGPDDFGLHIEPGVGLGHRRLSIIDLAGGKQPIFNEDGSVAITFNGEIYNFQALRDELVAAGHVFKAGDCIEQGGLAAPRRTDEHKKPAFIERYVDVLEHLHGAEALVQSVDF